MSEATITIDGRKLRVEPGFTVLQATRAAGLDIPALCYLEKCGPLNSCQVCLVKIDGRLMPSCGTKVHPDMVVESETEEVHEARRTAMELLFSDHVGDCLAPCQRLCPLGLNIPALLRHVHKNEEREAAQLVRSTLPLPGTLGRLCHHPCEQGCRRGHWDNPAGIRDIERHVAESGPSTFPFSQPSPSRKSVAIVGAGPAGLSAAFYLAQKGHQVTVLDRNTSAGGTLRDVDTGDLPELCLIRDCSSLEHMGIQFQFGVELGSSISLQDLSSKHSAVLLAIGSIEAQDSETLGIELSNGFIKADPHSTRTPLPNVFATGAAVRQTRQLVRVMAEAKAAAESVHRAVSGIPSMTERRPFSSVMGRVSPGELKQLLASSSQDSRVSPCDACAGLNKREAVMEASRCLHCDCRSSGNCLLQHYAQDYNVDANRFRSERRPFEQQVQPGGVIFESGKCILCGICVKLTEMAAEPLGLTFVGRGFDVRVAAPLNHAIEEGLQKTARECVEHCPTGALSFR